MPAFATATKAAAATRRRRATEEDDEAAIVTDDGRGMNDAGRRQSRIFIEGREAKGTATSAETFGETGREGNLAARNNKLPSKVSTSTLVKNVSGGEMPLRHLNIMRCGPRIMKRFTEEEEDVN